MSADSQYIAVTDIGTSKVVVIVGERPRPGQNVFPKILGMGECETGGALCKGRVLDEGKLAEALGKACQKAENDAHCRIKISTSAISITGPTLLGKRLTGEIAIPPNTLVRPQNLREAQRAAIAKESFPPGYTRCFSRGQPTFLDGILTPKPIGKPARSLKSGYWAVALDHEYQSLLWHLETRLGLHFDLMLPSSCASAFLHSTPRDRETGVLVLDIGAGVTDYVLYARGHIVGTDVLPVGGDHFDEDLCVAFGLKNHIVASKLRCENGLKSKPWPQTLPIPSDTNDAVAQDGFSANNRIPTHAVRQVLRARAADLFALIRARIGPLASPEHLVNGLILTGGMAYQDEIDDVAQSVFGRHVSPGAFPEWVPEKLFSFKYSTALGLFAAAHAEAAMPPPRRKSLWERIFRPKNV
ncbi:MAG: rod shape-determining protein [Puniceicoccales bacterium]|jgi:cell division protein FtsA|nr:rod shape-determining protein [Puniceicoccales bacterium]